MCSQSRLTVNYVTLAVGEVLLLILTVCSLAAIYPRVRRQNDSLVVVNAFDRHFFHKSR